MFEHKEMLYLLLFIPFAALFLFYSLRKKKKNMLRFVSPEILSSVSSINFNAYFIRNICIILCLFFIAIALAKPQYGAKTSIVSKKAATIIIVMDASKSMLAQDLSPNRLEKAKSVLSNLIAGFKGNKIGIISFAGTAFWQCPITLDVFSANNFLKSISVEDMPLGGTKIAKALDLALDGTADIPEGAKAIILVTDGEDDDSGLHILIEKAKKYKTKIYTVGIGNSSGSKILFKNDYVRDENGNAVITSLDEETLQYIADGTGGKYINLSESDDSMFKILQIGHSLDKAKDDASKEIRRDEKYQIFLFIALFLYCMSLFLSNLKDERKK